MPPVNHQIVRGIKKIYRNVERFYGIRSFPFEQGNYRFEWIKLISQRG